MSRLQQLEYWDFEVEGRGVVARPDLKGLFFLNPTAREIWRKHRAGASSEEIAAFFAATCGIPIGVALRDITATLQDWQQTLLAEHPPEHSALPSVNWPEDGTAHAIDCRLNGKHFRILLPPGDLVDEIAPRLESLRVPPSPPDITLRLVEADQCVCIFHRGELLAAEDHPAAARAVLLQEMVRLSASDRDFLAIFHAAACGSESKCIIFPAATHSGKTTL
ncbi:MAG: PqqD family protein, partial [Acidobacteriaceae bacterium]|nr:PqqD family protein [Acidobacteriaceae bacterium]